MTLWELQVLRRVETPKQETMTGRPLVNKMWKRHERKKVK
jgi:hypothetical protein